MKKIGMIVAVEIKSVIRRWGGELTAVQSHGWNVQVLTLPDKTLYIVRSGAGEIAAAAATQMLISDFDVRLIVNYGVVGALREDLKVAGPCVVRSVVHYDMDTSEIDHVEVGRYTDYPSIYIPTTPELVEKTTSLFPDVVSVVDASGDKFFSKKEDKIRLREQFKADICEMEAAGIVMTCDRCHVPNLLIKTISDSISGGAEEYTKQVDHAADVCLDVMDAVLNSME